MVTNRGMMKNKDKKTLLKTRRKLYRKRTKASKCRKKTQDKCKTMKKCKFTSGKKRKYCRKGRNTKRIKDKLYAKKK